MWCVYYNTNPAWVVSTRLAGLVSRRAYFGPLSPLRARRFAKTSLPGRRWVRVRNTMAGVSASDIDLIHLEASPRVAPLATPRRSKVFLGREVVGEVIEIGPEVEFLRNGDRVVYQLDQCCATLEVEPPCPQCASGNYSLCENRYLDGPEAIGGGWSDEMIVHEGQLFLVPDSLSDEQAALLEPTASAIHAVLRHQPPPGAQILVIGAETTGLLMIQALKALMPNPNVTAHALHAFQFELATNCGAARLLYQEDGGAGAARMTNAKRFHSSFGAEQLVGGFDIVYDTLGTANSLQNALRWTREGGTVVLVGQHLTPLKVDLTAIWHREVALVGSHSHGAENATLVNTPSTWGPDGGRMSSFTLAANLLRDHRLTPDRLITHRFPLKEFRRAVHIARNAGEQHAVKVMLDMRDLGDLTPLNVESLMQEANG